MIDERNLSLIITLIESRERKKKKKINKKVE